jgi:predicted dehydrogenase
MKTVKWGILGAARVNQRLLPAIENHPNCEIVMLASRRPNAAQECIDHYAFNKQKIKASEDFNEIIHNQDINAVYIPLANEEHTEVALKAITQKKHVLIEKPMALSKTEVEQITDAAKINNVMVMEGFMYAFHPQFDFIQKMIQSGRLGKIQYAQNVWVCVNSIRTDIPESAAPLFDGSLGGIGARWR